MAELRRGLKVFDFDIQVVNVGNTATNIVFSLDPPVGRLSTQQLDLLERNKQASIRLSTKNAFLAMGRLTYVDADGIEGSVGVSLKGSDSGQLSIGRVERLV